MKKIAVIIASTVVASSANAFITSLSGSLTDHTLREPFTYTNTPGISTSGNYFITIDTQGPLLNSGIMFIEYSLVGSAGGYAYDVDYSGVTYNLGSASGETLDQNYLGQGLWLTRFSWGYSRDNTVSWGTNKSQTLSAGKPTDVRDTNGSYLGARNGNNSMGQNGIMEAAGGYSSCIGNGCSLWSANSFGLEGMELYLVVNPNAGFSLVNNWVSMQEVVGTSAPFQISIDGFGGSGGEVPDTTYFADTYWIGGNGSWADASNWNGGTPTAGERVGLINNASEPWDHKTVTYAETTSPLLGRLVVDGTYYGNMTLHQTSGDLHTMNEIIGPYGQVIQSGGTHTVDAELKIGGTFTLDDGSLSVGNETIGFSDTYGDFVQNGGTHTIADTLTLGGTRTVVYPGEGGCYDDGYGNYYCDDATETYYGQGTYTLNDGVLNVKHIARDDDGYGYHSSLIVNGGTLNLTGAGASISVGEFKLGAAAGSQASFTLGINQSVKVSELTIGSDTTDGRGQFTQNLGTSTISDLVINRGSYTQNASTNNVGWLTIRSEGGYDLNGGILSAGWIHNAGQFTVAAGAAVIPKTYHSNRFTQTAGTTRIDGLLQRSIVEIQGGTLQGNGTIDSNVFVTGGTIQAGNSIGALTIDGDLTLDGGSLLTEIGGTGAGEFDLLTVTGNINLLSGELAFSFVDGFTAQAGDEWLFLAGAFAGSLEGLIFSYSGIPQGLNFIVSSTASGLKLSAVQAVPVPAVAWLMGSSLVGLAGVARRKKAA